MNAASPTKTVAVNVAPDVRCLLYPEGRGGGLAVERYVDGIGWTVDDDARLAAIHCERLYDPDRSDNDGPVLTGYLVSFGQTDGTIYQRSMGVREAHWKLLRIADAFEIDTAGLFVGSVCWSRNR